MTITAQYDKLKYSLQHFYYTSPGVANLRKLVLENDYSGTTLETRTPYQIDRYEMGKRTWWIVAVPYSLMGAYYGWKAGTEQFKKVNQLSIYTNKMEPLRLRQVYREMAALGYYTSTIIRTTTFVGCLFGLPLIAGVYNDDTDRVSHYALSGGLGGLLYSLLNRSGDHAGWRPRVLSACFGALPGLGMGFYAVLTQKYECYPCYENYKKKWREIDPMWADYQEKVSLETEESKESSL